MFLVLVVGLVFFVLWFDVFGFVLCLLMFVVRCWSFLVWCLFFVVCFCCLFGFGYGFVFWFWLFVLFNFVACVVCGT